MTNFTIKLNLARTALLLLTMLCCLSGARAQTTVEIGDGGTTNNSYLPSYSYYNYSLTQQIYTADEIGMAGTINSIAFKNTGAEKTRTYNVYMLLTDKETFESGTDWVAMSDGDLVFAGELTFTVGEWTTIDLDTPFAYDGSSNLIVGVADVSGAYTSQPYMACLVFDATSQAIRAYTDQGAYDITAPGVTGTVLNLKNQILLEITPSSGPTCEKPTGLTVNYTGGTTVEVSWEGEAETYNIDVNGEVIENVTSPYTLENLELSTTYNLKVQADCGGTEQSYWTSAVSFTTPAPPPVTIKATAEPSEGGIVTFSSNEGNGNELFYDFEDGWQGWTTFQGVNTTSPNSWMHNTAYPTSNNDFSTGYGYDSSDGFMLSESYISGSSSGSGTAVTPDNYLVSPRVRLGGSISFYAGARNTSYCEEKFSVMVSTTNNTNATSFTTVETWTLNTYLSSAGYTSEPFTVDLSEYSGYGYVAIRHFDCYDQWFLCIDNVTIVEGEDPSTCIATFSQGETCVVTATPQGDYHFVNWTENGTEVSSDPSYSFTVTDDRDLVANFAKQSVAEITFAKEGYSTFYYGEYDAVLPEGMKAYIVTDKGAGVGELVYEEVVDVVPAGTAVLLQVAPTESSQTIDINLVTPSAPEISGTNLLGGQDVEGWIEGDNDHKYYKLTYKNGEELGWYWGEDGGAPFTSGAHKAWLVLPTPITVDGARFFGLPGFDVDNTTTAVDSIEDGKLKIEDDWYSVDGRKLDKQPTRKGVYLNNGRKVVIK